MQTLSALDWLLAKSYSFEALTQEERDAVMHFSLLWTLFEARALGSEGSAQRILELTRAWEGEGKLTIEPFVEDLSYFRNRYFSDGDFTHHFRHLHLRRNDHPQLVGSILRGESRSVSDVLAALLIIVYRFRNNLFHGVKWRMAFKANSTTSVMLTRC